QYGVEGPLTGEPGSRMRTASVLVDSGLAPGAQKPELILKECYFAHGQDAVALTGDATLRASNCAFGPHAAMFHLRGGNKLERTSLHVSDCAAFVLQGAAFLFEEGAGARLSVHRSIFSQPNLRPESRPDTGGDAPDLIQRNGQ